MSTKLFSDYALLAQASYALFDEIKQEKDALKGKYHGDFTDKQVEDFLKTYTLLEM
jgi:hypothetical protein